MKNNVVPLITIGAIVLVGGFIFFNRLKPPSSSQLQGGVQSNSKSEFEASSDICQTLPLESVKLLTGKAFSGTKSFISRDGLTKNCQYNIDNHFIIVDVGQMDVTKQKKGNEILGRSISTDSRIPGEHFIVGDDGRILDIYLILGPQLFIRVGRSSTTVVTNDELVTFASHVAAISRGDKEIPHSSTSSVQTSSVPLPSPHSLARTFLELIHEKRISDAISMMSPTLVEDDSAKQAWGVQFNSFDSFDIKGMEDGMKDTWTDTQQEFVAVLSVKMKPEAMQAPIPNYGWENGENIRWIGMKKVGDKWFIDSIATGP